MDIIVSKKILKGYFNAGTHDGPVHADDVLSAVILSYIYINLNIVRTNSSKLIKMCDTTLHVRKNMLCLQVITGLFNSTAEFFWKQYGLEICSDFFPENPEAIYHKFEAMLIKSSNDGIFRKKVNHYLAFVPLFNPNEIEPISFDENFLNVFHIVKEIFEKCMYICISNYVFSKQYRKEKSNGNLIKLTK